MFRGVEAAPEKLVPLKWLGGGRDAVDAEREGGGLFGLSPGMRFGVAIAVLEGWGALLYAEKLCESLLDGPWGRLMIFREASCASEARCIGL
jgi:hypothetical protein